MTRQEYKQEAIKEVKRLLSKHAAASSLFDETSKDGNNENSTFFLNKMKEFEKRILEYI